MVLVAPGTRELGAAGLDVTGRRSALDGRGAPSRVARPTSPPPPVPPRPSAGVYDPAAYDGPVRCYAGGLVEFPTGGAEVTLVGAADPFRNDRADEHGNRALAVGLLARSPRVIWLDLHEREPAPTPSRTVRADARARPVGDRGAVDPGTRANDGGNNPPDDAPRATRQQGDQGDNEAQGGSSGGSGNPLAQAFPPAVWATLALLVLAAIALAAASARRLGRAGRRAAAGPGPGRRDRTRARRSLPAGPGPRHARWPPCRPRPGPGWPSTSGCRRTARSTRWRNRSPRRPASR